MPCVVPCDPVYASHQTESRRRHFAENRSLKLEVLEWVINGGDPPPAYKPATVVGRNASFSKHALANLFSGAREFLKGEKLLGELRAK